MKIRIQLIAAFTILVAIPLLIVGLVIFSTEKKQNTERARAQLDAIASIEKERLDAVLDQYNSVVAGIVSRTRLRDELSRGGDGASSVITRIITEAREPFSELNALAIFDSNANPVGRVGLIPEITNENIASLRAGEIGYILSTDRRYVIILRSIIRDGIRLGTVAARFQTDLIFGVLEDHEGLGETGEILLVSQDTDGKVFAFNTHRNITDEGGIFRDPKRNMSISLEDLLLGDDAAFTGLKDQHGSIVFAVTRHIEQSNWGIIVKIDQDEIDAGVKTTVNTLVVMSFVSLLFAAFMGYFLSVTLTAPIESLTTLTKQMKRGKLNITIPKKLLESKNEIGILARAFEATLARLGTIHSELEDRVEKRTHDLAKFKQAVESVRDGVSITTVDGKTVYVNQAWKDMYGYTDADIDEGIKVTVLPGAILPEGEQEDMQRAFAMGESFVSEQLTNITKSGKELPVRLSLSPVVEGEKTVYYVGLHQDVTEERHVDNAKSEFVSLASHQLRTPLSTINWYTEMLLDGDAGDLNKQQKTFLGEVYTGSRRMSALVKALLNVSRIELGTFAFTLAHVDVLREIRSVMDELKLEIDSRNLTLRETHASDVPTIYTDEKMLRIVFQNLLTNAVKYTPSGGNITIDIRNCKAKEKFGAVGLEADSVCISFKDTGLGIPEKQQKYIFSKLFRADNARIHDAEGTGLGLYVSKAIIEQNGGMLWFVSREGDGTTFYVTIPVVSKLKDKKGKELSG